MYAKRAFTLDITLTMKCDISYRTKEKSQGKEKVDIYFGHGNFTLELISLTTLKQGLRESST